jgi:polysaccharide deacetylase 2 family uncharacterized protein YibQ
MLLRVLTGFSLGVVTSAVALMAISTAAPLPERPSVGSLGPRSLLPPKEDLQTGLAGQAPIFDAGLSVDGAGASRPALPEIQPDAQPGMPGQVVALGRPEIGQPASVFEGGQQAQPPQRGSFEIAQDRPIIPAPGQRIEQPLPEAPLGDHAIKVAQDPAAAQIAQDVPEVKPAPMPDRVALLPQADPTQSARPLIGRPASSLFNREGSGGSRLPLASEAPVPRLAPAQAPVLSGGRLAPFFKYAKEFDVAFGQPIVSIVLIDEGAMPEDDNVGAAALSQFPYPISFAVDASHPGAAERAQYYRDLGMEVLALIDLPQEATAADTEVSMTAALQVIPEAIGVLEGPKTGLQGSKEMSDQVTQIAKDMGLGIVWQPKGFDTAAKLAVRENVPSQTIFRDFDSAGQKPTVIRRFLDNAAFRAGREGEVIMLGRLRPDTISALVVWGLQDRAARVSIAPVSTVLRVGLGG